MNLYINIYQALYHLPTYMYAGIENESFSYLYMYMYMYVDRSGGGGA